MSTQGTATVNFGTGALEATVVVTGQTGFGTSNVVEAWPLANETIGSLPNDGAWVEQMNVYATQWIAGTGFTILMKPNIGKAYGSYNVGWVWN